MVNRVFLILFVPPFFKHDPQKIQAKVGRPTRSNPLSHLYVLLFFFPFPHISIAISNKIQGDVELDGKIEGIDIRIIVGGEDGDNNVLTLNP